MQLTILDNTAHGDSGSWVISGDRLCGFIIAGRDSLPWAYMVAIDDVSTDIGSCFTETIIRLPSASENFLLLKIHTMAAKGAAFGNHPDRIGGKTEDARLLPRKICFMTPTASASSATPILKEKPSSSLPFQNGLNQASMSSLRYWSLMFALMASMFLVGNSDSLVIICLPSRAG